MKRLLGLMVSLILLTGILLGCAKTPEVNKATSTPTETETSTQEASKDVDEAAWPRTIVDDFGHTVTLEKKPERVVVLYFGHIESLMVLGQAPVGSTIAKQVMNGFATLKQYADEVEVIDLGNAGEPSMERILESEPDLIVGTARHKDIYDDLNKISPTILLSSSVDNWKDNINDYAELLGEEKKAEQYIAEVDALMIEAREKLSDYSDETFIVVADLGQGTFGVQGTKGIGLSFYDDEVGMGLTAPEGYPEGWENVSLEAIAAYNPDHILLVGILGSEANGYEATYLEREIQESSVWKSLKAVQSDNVHFIDPACTTGTPLGVKLAIETVVDSVVKE